MIFDPFMKSLLNQSFEYYSNFFNIVNDKETEIEREFNEYLFMDSPENTNLSVIEYWKSMQSRLPILSQIAFCYLSLSCGSCDVERAFSKFRDIQTTKRNLLSDKSINMYSVLNYNKDIQNNFMLF
jgi:hypothetical protein